jgi:hypothetical protein
MGHNANAGDPRNLGPGRYMLASDWKSGSKHGNYKPAPGFDGGADRFKTTRECGPPPGAYECKDINKAFKPASHHKCPFGVSDARLLKIQNSNPAPGSYEVACSWLKKSYNVTLDDTMLL